MAYRVLCEARTEAAPVVVLGGEGEDVEISHMLLRSLAVETISYSTFKSCVR